MCGNKSGRSCMLLLFLELDTKESAMREAKLCGNINSYKSGSKERSFKLREVRGPSRDNNYLSLTLRI
jgi:hypothetical protein